MTIASHHPHAYAEGDCETKLQTVGQEKSAFVGMCGCETELLVFTWSRTHSLTH